MILASGNQSAIEQAEGFLAHRHGQAALLPSSHPWKNAPPIFSPPVQPPLPQDPDADMYIASVEAADGQPLEAGVRAAINEFVVACKADASPFAGVSNFDAIKASCIMMGARTLAGALVPIIGPDPTNFNFVQADYNRITGLLGNGVNKYLNTNQLLSSFIATNFHVSVCANAPDNLNKILMGCRFVGGGDNSGGFEIRHNGFHYFSPAGISSQTTSPPLNTNVPILVGMVRNLSDKYIYRVNSQNYTINMLSGEPLNQPALLYQRGDNQILSNARLSFYSIGESVDLAALDARVTTLRNSIATALA
jgi:hypothetical protein